MATTLNTVTQRTLILKNVYAAPDHVHTRLYVAGEIHAIGDALMPQGLSTQLVALKVAAEDNYTVPAINVIQNKTNKGKSIDGDGPHPLSF